MESQLFLIWPTTNFQTTVSGVSGKFIVGTLTYYCRCNRLYFSTVVYHCLYENPSIFFRERIKEEDAELKHVRNIMLS